MKIDKSKSDRQLLGANRWKKSAFYGGHKNGSGALVYPGGFGKTYTALNHISKPYLDYKDRRRSVTVLVPREPLKNQWEDEILKILGDDYINYISVYTVQYLITNSIKIETDLLIVDEFHMFYESEFYKYVDGTNIKFHHNLALTATYKDPHNRHKKAEEIYPIIDFIGEHEAIENGWISKFIEYNLALSLPDDDITYYKQLTETITNNLDKFGRHGFNAVNKVLRGSDTHTGFQYACMHAMHMGWSKDCDEKTDAIWNPSVIIGYARTAMTAIQQRKEFLYNHPLKLKIAADITEKFKNVKVISFSQSTTFADLFAGVLRSRKIECVVYHSKLDSKHLIDPTTGDYFRYKSGKKAGQPKTFGQKTLKKFAIDAIKTGKINVISTASSLNTGFDVKDMRVGIISSRNRNYNDQKQRRFRITRVDPFTPDGVCLLVNIVFADTKDEQWLSTAQKENESNVHWITSIDDINFTVEQNEFEL